MSDRKSWTHPAWFDAWPSADLGDFIPRASDVREFKHLYLQEWPAPAPEPEPVIIGLDLSSQADATVVVIPERWIASRRRVLSTRPRQCGRRAKQEALALQALSAGQRVFEASERHGFRELSIDNLGRLVRKPAGPPGGRAGTISVDEWRHD